MLTQRNSTNTWAKDRLLLHSKEIDMAELKCNVQKGEQVQRYITVRDKLGPRMKQGPQSISLGDGPHQVSKFCEIGVLSFTGRPQLISNLILKFVKKQLERPFCYFYQPFQFGCD